MIDTHKLAIDVLNTIEPDDGSVMVGRDKISVIERALDDAYKAGIQQAKEDS